MECALHIPAPSAIACDEFNSRECASRGACYFVRSKEPTNTRVWLLLCCKKVFYGIDYYAEKDYAVKWLI